MAAITTTRTDLFPVGTIIGAHPIQMGAPETLPRRRNGTSGRPRTEAPSEPIAEAEMGVDGATFTDLAEGRYFLAAEVGGDWRILRVLV